MTSDVFEMLEILIEVKSNRLSIIRKLNTLIYASDATALL
jgi:hypothetical protein